MSFAICRSLTRKCGGLQEYALRIRARNAVGRSNWSEYSRFTTLRSTEAPGPVTFLSEEMGTAPHSLTVRWRPPAVAPGAKPTHSVLRYRVCSGDRTGARAAPEAEPEPEPEPEAEAEEPEVGAAEAGAEAEPESEPEPEPEPGAEPEPEAAPEAEDDDDGGGWVVEEAVEEAGRARRALESGAQTGRYEPTNPIHPHNATQKIWSCES